MPDVEHMHALDGMLFDKDGTLFGFQATWGTWAVDLLKGLAPGDFDRQHDLARRIGIDLAQQRFLEHSPVIAGTIDESVTALLPGLSGWSARSLHSHILEKSMDVQPVEAAPLRTLLADLAEAGLALGVATNDNEEAARAQLSGLGVEEAFDFIAGADSGFGAKPEPGQCNAFVAATGLRPERIAMVGDSTHDLRAGRAAGMICVAVLTGVADRASLESEADVVLPNVGHLPAWIGMSGS